MTKIDISPMTSRDLETISPILQSDFDDFWSNSNLESELNNSNSHCFVAKFENEIVGFASILQILDEIHLDNIVVKKDFRNLGIGKQLLEHLINICTNINNVRLITLEVNETNTIAQKLYEDFGFKKLGIRKNYYGLNKNAIIMTKYI